MKNLLLIFVLISVTSCTIFSQDFEWENFKIKFKKGYRSLSHELERKAIFIATLESIEEHNAKYEAGLSTYYQGVNFYSDWTWEEFESILLRQPISDQKVCYDYNCINSHRHHAEREFVTNNYLFSKSY